MIQQAVLKVSQAQMLEQYLHDQIPLSVALGVQVALASRSKIIIHAPLANNINHKKTVFGGSLHAIATLACWGLLYLNLKDQLDCSEIVITHSEIDFLLPVTDDFSATAMLPEPPVWDKFIKTLERKGKARIQLGASVSQNGVNAVVFQGTFAVLKKVDQKPDQ